MIKVIAEFCQNHNGDYSLLEEMIHQASEAGATFGKIQTIFAKDLSFRSRFEKGKQVNGVTRVMNRPYKNEYDRLKNLELTYEQQHKFVQACTKFKLIPLTTCFAKNQILDLRALDLDTIKVASYDCGSLPLIKELSKSFNNMIISTGASYDHEIEATANYLNQINYDFIFLHCVTIYPTPLSMMHLNRMDYLKKYTKNIGFSDHSNAIEDGIKASIAAIYSGSEYIERHYRTLGPDESRDGVVSIDAKQLKDLINFSKMTKADQDQYIIEFVPELELMKGERKRYLSDEELLNRDYYRGRFCSKINNKTIFNWED